MATVRDGIFLEQNRPRRSQFRAGRRDPVKSVIVVHTAESGTDRSGPDPKAENVASFIQNRSDPGSYHLIGDADSIIQMIRFENEAFHDRTGSNRWAIGLSLAMNAADWSGLTASRRRELTETAAQMAAIAARWLDDRGLPLPAPQRLTKVQSDRSDASGFISHARRDPSRRTDPGTDFPWSEFFRLYQQQLSDGGVEPPPEALIRELQSLVGATPDGIVGPLTIAALNRNWLGRDESFDDSVADTFTNNPLVIEWVQARINAQPGFSVVVDGQFGPSTESAVKMLLGRGGVITAESFLTLVGE
jgi:peptidoglycan hydrolase-like protein with peptidoglycan-binding domain